MRSTIREEVCVCRVGDREVVPRGGGDVPDHPRLSRSSFALPRPLGLFHVKAPRPPPIQQLLFATSGYVGYLSARWGIITTISSVGP